MSDQREVIDFLSRAESYGQAGDSVERIDTHGSLIFLCGERAYKLKREIAYASLDFRTLHKRERACHAELRLNRRTAPAIYLEARAVTRGRDGRLAFGGDGEVLDWVVVMRRFPQSALFERMALAGRLTPPLMQALGKEVARFHAAAERTPAFGGSAGIRQAIESNHVELARYRQLLDASSVNALYRDQLGLLSDSRLPNSSGGAWLARYDAAMATCVWPISACSPATRHCSMASSSATRSPA